jgi:hypothetical protein
MKNIHLVVPDLFLPKHVATEASSGLALPALLTLLSRAQSSQLAAASLEDWLCDIFCVKDRAIAPVTLQADGVGQGISYWLRTDPVHLRLQRDQLILQSAGSLSSEEAQQLCITLNAHFSDAGLSFFAPHPQRWYLKLDAPPEVNTHYLAQVIGKDVQKYLPYGLEALHWHGVFNEIQMLLFENEVNLAREMRGELPINSVWFWGGGQKTGKLAQPFVKIYGNSDLAEAFARVAGILYVPLQSPISQYHPVNESGDELIVFESLRHALQNEDVYAWREGLLHFENAYATPLLGALRSGRIDQLTLDIPGAGASRRWVLTRAASWKFWLRKKSLANFTL